MLYLQNIFRIPPLQNTSLTLTCWHPTIGYHHLLLAYYNKFLIGCCDYSVLSYDLQSKQQPGSFCLFYFFSFQSSFKFDPHKPLFRLTIIMVIIIAIILPRKQSPCRLSDLHENRSHSLVEPKFNYRASCLRALPCGPQILNVMT